MLFIAPRKKPEMLWSSKTGESTGDNQRKQPEVRSIEHVCVNDATRVTRRVYAELLIKLLLLLLLLAILLLSSS